MGYQMPIVCKEVYLPFSYSFLTANDGLTFDAFSKEYLKVYGINLYDIFELSNIDGDIRLCTKNPIKLYSIGIDENRLEYNVVNESLLTKNTATVGSSDITLAVLMCGIGDDFGCGISIVMERYGDSLSNLKTLLYEI